MALDTIIGMGLAPSPYQEISKFLYDLLDPEVFGHSVTEEIRNEARRLLGLKNVPITDAVSKVYSPESLRPTRGRIR